MTVSGLVCSGVRASRSGIPAMLSPASPPRNVHRGVCSGGHGLGSGMWRSIRRRSRRHSRSRRPGSRTPSTTAVHGRRGVAVRAAASSQPDDLVLDVAAGTGHVARALAPNVRAVVGGRRDGGDARPGWTRPSARRCATSSSSGPTPPRCRSRTGRSTSSSRASRSTTSRTRRSRCGRWRAAAARAARWPSATCSATRTRTIAAAQNRLERLRDPSHTRMLPLAELAARLVAGPTDARVRDVERPLEPWLAQTSTAKRRGRSDPRGARRASSRAARRPGSGRATCGGDAALPRTRWRSISGLGRNASTVRWKSSLP